MYIPLNRGENGLHWQKPEQTHHTPPLERGENGQPLTCVRALITQP